MLSEELHSTEKMCVVCGKRFELNDTISLLEETAFHIDLSGWEPPDDLCPCCRENRGMLAMMYLVDR